MKKRIFSKIKLHSYRDRLQFDDTTGSAVMHINRLCDDRENGTFSFDHIEQKERYIKLVMFYAFTKCQLLKPVGT